MSLYPSSQSARFEDGAPTDRYSPLFAFVYIFNLIIGVGALSLPQSFSEAGVVLGTVLLVVLASMSYMTATFMVEAMAAANAYVRYNARRSNTVVEAQSSTVQSENETDKAYIKGGNRDEYDRYSPIVQRRSVSPRAPPHADERTPLVAPILSEGTSESSSREYMKGGNEDSSDEDTPLTSSGTYSLPPGDYEIDKKFEMGTMANMFYHPIGIVLYYLAICLYLYGDLAIYAVAIPKSLVVVTCTKPSNASDGNDSTDATKYNGTAICFGNVTQQQTYYIFLAVTCLCLCPWTFFDITRSKYIQLFTTILRNIAFVLMVIIAIIKLAEGHQGHPKAFNIYGFPTLFGVSIYSFMCQHSLPGMVTPMRSKRNIFVLILVDFALILSFYLVLAYTGAFLFPFEVLNDIYTLNFFTQFSRSFKIGRQVLAVLGYYLALFPVFTLSTNFPIISITLRENLKSLAGVLFRRWRGDKPFHKAINKFVFPVLALLPAIGISFATTNVQILVSITGSFPGIAVQYVVPVTLAFAGKYIISKKLNVRYENKYKSPFSYVVFLVVVLVWTVISVGLIIADDAVKIVQHKFFNND